MHFRLLLDSPLRGALNMALDETLLRRSASEAPLPTLRFYSWQPHCLSLGRLQKTLPPGALLPASERDFDLVRRPTGGRAVWHERELTYSISAPLSFLPGDAQSVQGAYEWISRGFTLGLQSLGVVSELAPSPKPSEGGPNCFAQSAACDFQVGGKKLIGAAQCRLNGAFLQHGSLLLRMNAREWEARTGGPMSGATSLEELGLDVEPQRVAQVLSEGFARATGAQLQEGTWTDEEQEEAERLRAGKYEDVEWTMEGKVVEMMCSD